MPSNLKKLLVYIILMKNYRIKGQLNERITAVLSDFYTYIVFDILFVESKRLIMRRLTMILMYNINMTYR